MISDLYLILNRLDKIEQELSELKDKVNINNEKKDVAKENFDFITAIKYMLEGKKIMMLGNPGYLYFDKKSGAITDNEHNIIFLSSHRILSKDWSIFE